MGISSTLDLFNDRAATVTQRGIAVSFSELASTGRTIDRNMGLTIESPANNGGMA